VDITRELVEVAPTAQYSIGGVRGEPATRATRVPSLFAAGEVTAGVHGANRLGGNCCSGASCSAGERDAAAAACAPFAPSVRVDPDQIGSTSSRGSNEGQAVALRRSSHCAGNLRTLPTTQEPDPRTLATALDFDNLFLTAEATAWSAWRRPVEWGG